VPRTTRNKRLALSGFDFDKVSQAFAEVIGVNLETLGKIHL
jgi:hypothetical protein